MLQAIRVPHVSITRAVIGAALIAMGVLALMDVIGIFNFGAFVAVTWPLLFVVAGILVLANNTRNWLWGAVLIGAGTVSFLNVNNLVPFTVWEIFWPVVILLLGIRILTRTAAGDVMAPVHAANTTDQFALMSGSEQRIVSKSYTGGRATAIMGGIELDLREATIRDNATIEVFALMGAVDIKVPAGVNVKSEVIALLGGVEIKADTHATADAPLLIINGTVALGGVDVKY